MIALTVGTFAIFILTASIAILPIMAGYGIWWLYQQIARTYLGDE